MENSELKWNDFKMNVELFRSYLDLSIKLNMFYYAITGAILSFYFSNSELPLAKYALALPLLLSFALSVFFFISAKLAFNLSEHLKQTAQELGLGGYPAGIVLVMLCVIFGTVLGIVSLGLIWYLLCK